MMLKFILEVRTTDGHKLMHAQHTLTILSIVDSSILSSLFAIS